MLFSLLLSPDDRYFTFSARGVLEGHTMQVPDMVPSEGDCD